MKDQDRYKTILVIVSGLLVISWIFEIPLLISIAVGVGMMLSALFPFVAKWIEWGWLKLALALGWINARILFTIIYFLFLLPIAWFSRLFTKDPLKLKGKHLTTLYTSRDHQYKKEDLENIW